jgi:hypothetical protein
MAGIEPGAHYTYTHDVGLAAHHTPDLHPDMAALDLTPNTTVTVVGHDTDRDLVLVEWTDAQGNPRTTSVQPDTFADYFTEVNDAD